jgi:hypothetical protein
MEGIYICTEEVYICTEGVYISAEVVWIFYGNATHLYRNALLLMKTTSSTQNECDFLRNKRVPNGPPYKPTHTDKYLSYESHHPVSHKRSVAKTLLQRAESLPSNSDSQANEREYVLNILGGNDYPKRFLNDSLRSPVCRNQNNSEDDTSVTFKVSQNQSRES